LSMEGEVEQYLVTTKFPPKGILDDTFDHLIVKLIL